MEEVQSWWEVPAVAHFCYAFRSAFNLVFFEIAELESALLDMQDPDMCLSLEQLIMRILQGFENEPVTEENWEETLDDLFSETLEDNENPLDKNLHFLQLSARKKLEVLFKLCELRLDVKDAIDAIKDIASKDMNATCLGKDSQNNSYWYFYDERLYKEATSSSNGKKALQNVKDIKNASSKSKMVNIREKRTKSSIDSSWSIVCYSLSDWEKLIKTLSKSRNSHEKKLVNNMKEHLGVVQENVAEKDRLLRKRFIELAPKRTSSRILKVQEKKKLDEINAQKAAEKAKVKEEKEQAKKEAKRKKLEIIERQKRAEERRKAMEEAIEGRAARAKLREVARAMGSDDSDDEEENDDNEDEEEENDDDKGENENDDDKGENENDDDEEEEALHKRGQKRQASRHYQHPKYKSKNKSDSSEDDSSNESEEASSDSEQKSVNRFRSEQIKSKQTYYNRKNKIKQPETNGQQRGSPRLRNYSKIVKYKSNKESVSEKEDEVSKVNEDTRVSARLKKIRLNNKKQSNLDSIKDGSSCDAYSDSANGENLPTVHKKSLAKENSLSHTYSNGTRAVVSRSVSPRISHYKNTVLQNSSDVSKWNSTFDSKGQKLHILHDAYDNLSSKKVKLQHVKTFASSTQNLKSSLSKENKVYQPFHHKCVISYSKFSPTTIRLDFKKSSTTSF